MTNEVMEMSDLISRQDAIEYLVNNMAWFTDDGYEPSEEEKTECIKELINGVPSADRPKWVEENDFAWTPEPEPYGGDGSDE